MLTNMKIKFEWYSNRFLSEIYIRKVIFFSSYKVEAKLHQLPKDLIISLTSYKPRFATLFPTILSLIQQKVVPNLIILWVADEDFNYIPEEILNLRGIVNEQGTVFDIIKTQDTGPYKKIIPCIKKYPNNFIVTADDDIYYPPWWLKYLVNEYNGIDSEIISYLTHEITFNKFSNSINPYNDWVRNKQQNVDGLLGFAVGAGGVFYPPYSLDDLVSCHDIFLKECAMADDIWLFWMARKKGSTTRKTKKYFKPICWPSSQKVSLLTSNVQNNANDQKIRNMLSKFGWPISTTK
ncbi:hypothetical protein [Paraglaciecola sp. 20A4]|uniref:hypothetical protein n=1 Tax=Paraglaciecola sp. 20A4 TaxID=2687288 RepID=UPI00140A2923|nr:hypothetical protein [Paraglaciecola sp. 20A4]